MTTNTNTPRPPSRLAFPTPGKSVGMSMRDWYAGMALHGIISHPEWVDSGYSPELAASQAFQYADAMMARAAKEAM